MATVLALPGLNAKQLQRIAILLASPSSGNKATIISGIENASANAAQIGFLKGSTKASSQSAKHRPLSLVSIDMGIKNMAYSHLLAPLQNVENHTLPRFATPTLHAWTKLSVGITLGEEKKGKQSATDSKESFEPIDLAKHAYVFMRGIIDQCNPDHIIIERQRFRSGGGSAVQEWTLRVGMLEGMLYAIHKTLSEEAGLKCVLEPVHPKRVNRYWLQTDAMFAKGLTAAAEGPKRKKASTSEEDLIEDASTTVSGKATSKQVKAEKTRLLHRLFRHGEHLRLSENVKEIVQDFLKNSDAGEGVTPKDVRTASRSKVDDLSDCMLQGLAWISWQNNRAKLLQEGPEVFDIDGSEDSQPTPITSVQVDPRLEATNQRPINIVSKKAKIRTH